MKKINVEKTIENIDIKREEGKNLFFHSWEKDENNNKFMYLWNQLNYEFGLSEDGIFIEGWLNENEFLRFYGDCVVYEEGEKND